MRCREWIFLGATFGLCALVLSCADRERTNPFDPNNPDTGGRPSLLEAVAGDGEAELSWEVEEMHDLEAYRLVRSNLSGPPGGNPVTYHIEAGRTFFVDTGLTNGTTYLYELAFVFGGVPIWVNSDTVTPGTAVPWVLDGYAGILVRLSPDGRDRTATFAMSSYFFGFDVVESDESAWVSDYFNRKAFHVDRDGLLVEEFDLSGFPVSLVVDEARSEVWVSESEPTSLVRYSGGLADVAFTVPHRAVALAVDETTGDLWACSSSGGWVTRVGATGLVMANGFSSPKALAFDHTNRVVWVTGSTEVVKLDTDLQVMQRIPGFASPAGIAVDQERGDVWIADTENARIVKLSSEGEVRLTVTGFEEPWAVAVDALKEECWVADSMTGEVIRVSAAGEIIERKGGFLAPFGIAVIP